MNITFHQQVFIFFSTVGCLQSIVFGAYLWSIHRVNRRTNLWFTLLILAVSVRMTKWIGRSFPDVQYGEFYEKIGLSMYLIVGPLLYFYFRAFCGKNTSLFPNRWLHFLPFGILAIASIWMPIWFWGKPASQWVFVHLFIYILLSFRLIKPLWHTPTPERNWAFTLWAGICLLFVLSVAYMAFFAISYIVLAVGFTVIVYVTTFVGFKYKSVFVEAKKNKLTVVQDTELQLHLTQLEGLFLHDKIFTDSLLTLPKVAEKMRIPPYLLSQLINEQYKQTFPDFINSRRVEYAKELIAADSQQKLKIATVAFQAGFNTLSTFNAAFKKYAHQTPSEYRKAQSEGHSK